MRDSQAHYSPSSIFGLEFGSTGKSTLFSKDLEAAEVLGKALTGSASRVGIGALGGDLVSDNAEEDDYAPTSDECRNDGEGHDSDYEDNGQQQGPQSAPP